MMLPCLSLAGSQLQEPARASGCTATRTEQRKAEHSKYVHSSRQAVAGTFSWAPHRRLSAAVAEWPAGWFFPHSLPESELRSTEEKAQPACHNTIESSAAERGRQEMAWQRRQGHCSPAATLLPPSSTRCYLQLQHLFSSYSIAASGSISTPHCSTRTLPAFFVLRTSLAFDSVHHGDPNGDVNASQHQQRQAVGALVHSCAAACAEQHCQHAPGARRQATIQRR